MYICKCESDKTGLYDNVMIHLCFIFLFKKQALKIYFIYQLLLALGFHGWWSSIDQNIFW